MVKSQAPEPGCERPPLVDPRTCCNITKNFDQTDYPECFTDEVAYGAGGFRGSNRQRRSAWGGHGGYFGHHGHDDHDHFHHGPSGFHGPSGWGGFRHSGQDGGFRGSDDSESNYRSGQQDNNGQDNNGGYGYRTGYNGNVGFRGVQRETNFRDTDSRQFAGESNMKAFSVG